MEMTETPFQEPKISSGASGRLPRSIFLLTLVSAIGGFLFGYDTGVVSGSMLLIREEFELSNLWHELIVSATIAAAWISSLAAGPVADAIGRKKIILSSSAIFTVGAIILGCSPNKEVLLLGRVVVGVGIGFSSMCVPIYLSEIAPVSIRGRITVTNTLFITGGQFIASVICGLFSSVDHGWRWMLGLGGVPSIVQFFAFIFAPESPRWLTQRNRKDEAKIILARFRPALANVEEEIEAIVESCDKQKDEETGFVALIRVNPVRRALILGCLLQLFQQISGINTVMYYSASIISMAGVHDDTVAIWLSSVTSFVNFSFTFVGLWLVERIGRRPLTLGSLSGVTFSLLLLALSFHLVYLNGPDVTHEPANKTECSTYSSCSLCTRDPECGFCYREDSGGDVANASCLVADHDEYNEVSVGGFCLDPTDEILFAYDWCPSSYAWLSLVSLCLYLAFFAPGMGTMPWTINSEIYPNWARAKSTSIATSVNWGANLLVSLTFLSLTEAITKHGTFYLYMGLALIGLVVFFLVLPETKGIPLEEMDQVFMEPLITSKPWKKTNSNTNLINPESYGSIS